MVFIAPVSHFFEPSAPTSTVPLLTAHTELRKGLKPSLIAQELPLKHKSVRFNTAAAGSAPPSPILSLHTSTNSDTSSSFDENEDCDGVTTDEDEPPEDNLIPKPEGENGRPGRGGYNLEVALGWDSKTFRKLKARALLQPKERR